ncbi:diacylglycerol kinase family protein [Dokdonia sp. Hel_I_53]|uniref:diacylglycerol kinase family protein n=1 Tax=Dokdonia sp. Hel_I_53 TaxID=1566287 RepID=UPI0011995F0A|nr:diacylglycerol kinase family protein [Dokdonia sp. Hel_I_53]TVZ50944.1 diacylglycerol kinase (ATP) [Dokdonia sp. Hel_I_53]
MPIKFIVGRLKGMKYSLQGGLQLIRSEASIQVQFGIAILVTIAGFYFEISRIEWMAQTLCIGLVMTAEGLNTAIEGIADFIHPDFHVKIGKIKDVAAGAVGIAALASVVVAVIIYFPKVF